MQNFNNGMFGITFEQLHTWSVEDINKKQIEVMFELMEANPQIIFINKATNGKFSILSKEAISEFLSQSQTQKEINLLRNLFDTEEKFKMYEEFTSNYTEKIAQLQKLTQEILKKLGEEMSFEEEDDDVK